MWRLIVYPCIPSLARHVQYLPAVTPLEFDACFPNTATTAPGFERLSQDIDQQKPDTQAKISTLFKPGKDTGASPSTPAKRPAASRVTKKAQHEQQAELAQQAEQTGHAQQTEEEHKAQQSQAAAVAGRRLEEEAAILAADAAVPMVQSPGNGSLDGRTTLSARAARLQSRLNQQHTMEPASPGEARAGKRRRASMVSHAPSQMTFCNYQHVV